MADKLAIGERPLELFNEERSDPVFHVETQDTVALTIEDDEQTLIIQEPFYAKTDNDTTDGVPEDDAASSTDGTFPVILRDDDIDSLFAEFDGGVLVEVFAV